MDIITSTIARLGIVMPVETYTEHTEETIMVSHTLKERLQAVTVDIPISVIMMLRRSQ
jgi:hypothetical protein